MGEKSMKVRKNIKISIKLKSFEHYLYSKVIAWHEESKIKRNLVRIHEQISPPFVSGRDKTKNKENIF